MRVVHQFPRPIREIENTWITLGDGTRLAARIWLPVDAEADKVPAILEYLPYRKRDFTAVGNALMHPYFAGHGYAAASSSFGRACPSWSGIRRTSETAPLP